MINNALSLDDVLVNEIMTPRTVVHVINGRESVASLLNDNSNIPFRIPIYEDQIENITGVVRRRDILAAKASGNDGAHIRDLAKEAIFVPDNAAASDALQTFKESSTVAITVDEFGSMSG